MATATTELTPRLVRLFAQAGLIDDVQVERFREAHGKNKNIVDILQQDVSLKSFKELLFAEIPVGRGRKGPGLQGVGDGLGGLGSLRAEEILHLLSTHRPQVDAFIGALDLAGIADADMIRAKVHEAEKEKTDVYEALMRNWTINPELVRAFLASPRNPYLSACSLVIAIAILKHNALIVEEQAARCLERLDGDKVKGNGSRPDVAAAAKGLGLNSEHLFERLERGLELPHASFGPKATDAALVSLFPHTMIRAQMFLPISQDDRAIHIAVSDPLHLELAILIRWILGKWTITHFTPSGLLIDRINEGLGTRPAAGPEILSTSTAIPAPAGKTGKSARAGKQKESLVVAPSPAGPGVPAPAAPPAVRDAVMVLRPGEAPADNLSAVQLVSSLIESAIELRATDIHLESTRTSMIVRFRIDGLLTKILSIPPNMIGPVVSRIKVLASMDVTERRRPQDGHIMLDIADRHFDFRVATLPTVFGEKVAIRVLDSARVMTGMGELGFNDDQLEVAKRLLRKPYGIILVTGPTGSGKTSTLYAALKQLNSEDRHLVTIEDPVEYQLNGINQIEVDPSVGLTFSEGLRAILRQDPNVIMVGEIRDGDTCKTAIRAALTGHLVFSTLHTNSAVAAFQALANLDASPFMIGSAVMGVISQRLVRMLCLKCQKSKPITKAVADGLGVPYRKTVKYAQAEGCSNCLGTGYSGRTGIFEIMELNEEMRGAVMANESPSRLAEIAREQGVTSIREAAMEKLKAGITSPAEIIQKVFLEA